MYTIRDKKDLEVAYSILKLIDDDGMEHMTLRRQKKQLELKAEIRRYHKVRKPYRRILKGDYDGYVEVLELPSTISSKEEAEDYFIYNEKRICRPSQYDCTGQLFTKSHSIVQRRGSFWLVHDVGRDV